MSIGVDVDVNSLPPMTVTKIGAIGPVTVDGIPDTYHIDVQNLPKIQIGLDPVTLTLNPVTLNPVDVGIRLEKIPDIRGHLPADFSVGLSLLGVELACVRLCGEAQVITEPYHPGPCEVCGERTPAPPQAIRPVRAARR